MQWDAPCSSASAHLASDPAVPIRVIPSDLAHWQAIYRDQVLTLPHIAELESLLTIATLKREEVLPV